MMGTGLRGRGSALAKEGKPRQSHSIELAAAKCLYLFYRTGLSFGKPCKVCLKGVRRRDIGMQGFH